jgi:uncharacterized protein YukE
VVDVAQQGAADDPAVDREAAERFGQVYEQWQRAAADVIIELAELHKLIVTAHGNHSLAVRTNVAIWRV